MLLLILADHERVMQIFPQIVVPPVFPVQIDRYRSPRQRQNLQSGIFLNQPALHAVRQPGIISVHSGVSKRQKAVFSILSVFKKQAPLLDHNPQAFLRHVQGVAVSLRPQQNPAVPGVFPGIRPGVRHFPFNSLINLIQFSIGRVLKRE